MQTVPEGTAAQNVIGKCLARQFPYSNFSAVRQPFADLSVGSLDPITNVIANRTIKCGATTLITETERQRFQSAIEAEDV